MGGSEPRHPAPKRENPPTPPPMKAVRSGEMLFSEMPVNQRIAAGSFAFVLFDDLSGPLGDLGIAGNG